MICSIMEEMKFQKVKIFKGFPSDTSELDMIVESICQDIKDTRMTLDDVIMTAEFIFTVPVVLSKDEKEILDNIAENLMGTIEPIL